MVSALKKNKVTKRKDSENNTEKIDACDKTYYEANADSLKAAAKERYTVNPGCERKIHSESCLQKKCI